MNQCMAQREQGSVLVVSVMILMLLSVIGVAAFKTTNIELYIARNDEIAKENFYTCESGLNQAMALSSDWLNGTSALLTSNASHGFFLDLDADGTDETVIGVERITTNSTNSTNLPSLPHISTPPAGSGFGVKHFEVRRFAISVTTNSTSGSGQTAIQGGCWKIFQK